MEQEAVRDASPGYSVETGAASAEVVPPGYKRTEVGVIPADWEVQRIGGMASIKRGASPRPIADPKWFDTKSEIGWLRISDLAREGKYIRATDQSLSKAGVARSRLVKPGNVIMSMAATVGRPTINRKTVCIHDGFVVFDKAHVSAEFFYYLLLGIENAWAERGQTGSQVNLNTHIIGSTPVACPATEDEQRAIATALSDADALLESLDRLIAKKRAIKQATMQQLLTGQTRLPGFTGEWASLNLSRAANLRPGINKPTSEMGAGTLYVTVQDLYEGVSIVPERLGRIRLSQAEIEAGVLEEGDIVFGKSSVKRDGIGYPSQFLGASEPAVCSGFTYRARPDRSIVDARYLFYWLRSSPVRRWLIDNSQASALTNINKAIADAIPVKAPSVPEQTAIATVLSDMDTEIEALEHRRDKARQIKQGMMQELLTGRTRLV